MEQIKVGRTIWIDAPCDRIWQTITDSSNLAQRLLPPALGADMKREANGNLIEVFEAKEAK
jgi:hypothetical protein